MGRIMFLAGAALGYILGARAGRRRYEQIKAGAERLWNDPKVQQGVDQVQGFVKDKAPDVQGAIVDGAKKAASSAASTVQRRKPGASTTGSSAA